MLLTFWAFVDNPLCFFVLSYNSIKRYIPGLFISRDKFYHCHMLFCIYDRTCIWPGCTCFGSIQRNKNFGIKTSPAFFTATRCLLTATRCLLTATRCLLTATRCPHLPRYLQVSRKPKKVKLELEKEVMLKESMIRSMFYKMQKYKHCNDPQKLNAYKSIIPVLYFLIQLRRYNQIVIVPIERKFCI